MFYANNINIPAHRGVFSDVYYFPRIIKLKYAIGHGGKVNKCVATYDYKLDYAT